MHAETGLSNEPMRRVLRGLGFHEGERINVSGLDDIVFELTRTGWEANRESRAE